MGIYFSILNYFGSLRIDPLEEEVGMDISRHKGSAYDMKSAETQAVKELENSRNLLEDRSLSRRGSRKNNKENKTKGERNGEESDKADEPKAESDAVEAEA